MEHIKELGNCPRDQKNSWIFSDIAKGYICIRCVLDGMYIKEIVNELEIKNIILEKIELKTCHNCLFVEKDTKNSIQRCTRYPWLDVGVDSFCCDWEEA
jgi:hypothetical protein